MSQFSSMVQRSCPDCDQALTEITLIDHNGFGSPIADLRYAAAGKKPKKGPFSSTAVNQTGSLSGWLCEQCRRVFLYAK